MTWRSALATGPAIMTFGEKPRALRKAKKLSQQDLAERIYPNFQYLSKIENGRLDFAGHPCEETMLKLAEPLNLWKSGREVRVAYDRPTASEMSRGHLPDMTPLDISLPGMSGYEVARAVRELGSVSPVAMTAHVEDERGREAGFDHYLVKPIGMDDLL